MAARRSPVGNHPPEPAAVAGDELVEPVHERGGVEHLERAAERPGHPELGEDRDASAGVARKRRAVAEHEPPALVPRLLRHCSQKAARLVVGERQERQLFASVDRGDDTRRPATELSSARVEEYGSRQLFHPREPIALGEQSPRPRGAPFEARAACGRPRGLVLRYLRIGRG
jgi:hypothetical protein